MRTSTVIVIIVLAMFTGSSGNPAVDIARVMNGASTIARVFVDEDKAESAGMLAAMVAFPFAVSAAALKAWAADQFKTPS